MLLTSLALLATSLVHPNLQDTDASQDRGAPPVVAPFGKLDSVCTNDWWNRKTSPILETRVPRDEVVAFGIYTVYARALKLTAQRFPFYPDESRSRIQGSARPSAGLHPSRRSRRLQLSHLLDSPAPRAQLIPNSLLGLPIPSPGIDSARTPSGWAAKKRSSQEDALEASSGSAGGMLSLVFAEKA